MLLRAPLWTVCPRSLKVLNFFIIFFKIIIATSIIFKSLHERCKARGDVKISHKRQVMGMIITVVILVGPRCTIQVRWVCRLNGCSSLALGLVKLLLTLQLLPYNKAVKHSIIANRRRTFQMGRAWASVKTPWGFEQIRIVYFLASPISRGVCGRDLTKTPWEVVGARESEELPPQGSAPGLRAAQLEWPPLPTSLSAGAQHLPCKNGGHAQNHCAGLPSFTPGLHHLFHRTRALCHLSTLNTPAIKNALVSALLISTLSIQSQTATAGKVKRAKRTEAERDQVENGTQAQAKVVLLQTAADKADLAQNTSGLLWRLVWVKTYWLLFFYHTSGPSRLQPLLFSLCPWTLDLASLPKIMTSLNNDFNPEYPH